MNKMYEYLEGHAYVSKNKKSNYQFELTRERAECIANKHNSLCKEKDKEIERLNNIINELEEELEKDFHTFMLCSPECYCKIRSEMSEKIRYERELREYNIPILYIIGIKVPVVLRRDMPEDVQFQIMYRENYERLEKEEMYRKFMDMWEKY